MSKRKLAVLSAAFMVGILVALASTQGGFDLQGRFGLGTSSKMSCSNAPANTVYVSSTGTVKGDGTAMYPYKNFSALQSRLETDSTVEGVCFGGELTGSLELDSSLGSTLTMMASTAGATLGSSSSATDVLAFNGGDLNTLALQGLTFKDSVDLSDLDSVTVSGNTFALESGEALKIAGTASASVEKNTFKKGSTTAISLYQVGKATIQNNFIVGQTTKGVNSRESSLKLYHNSFYNNKYAVYMNGTASLKNNIFYSKASQYALYYEYVSTFESASEIQVDLDSDYNLFYSTDGSLAYVETTEELSSGGESTGSAGVFDLLTLSDLMDRGLDAHSIEGDPLYVDPSNNNLHIASGSPAQNAATTILSVSTDIDGDRRAAVTRSGSASADIGADEL